ncbi:MAG: TonB-dependent receptor [Pseudomonadota bacterium]
MKFCAFLVLLLLLGMTAAQAQSVAIVTATAERANENAVRQADDAFGISIGREELGLYGSSDIRGFSPIAAGNARIDGLYFDQFLRPITRIRQSTNIRVGLASQGFIFPAPTGVVDYTLRKPGNEAAASAIVSANHWGSVEAEVDAAIPIVKDKLALQAGVYVAHQEFYNATNAYSDNQGVAVRWTPALGIEIMPFWTRSFVRNDDAGQIYVQTSPSIPPPPPRRQFAGPDWAAYTGTAGLWGATAFIALGPSTTLSIGGFHSFFDDERSATNLAIDLQPDGTFDQLVFLDPPSLFESDSGEVRLSESFTEGTRQHQLHVSLRGRDRFQRYDGAAIVDLGRRTFADIVSIAEPNLEFREQSLDRIKQWTAGIAYELLWTDLGEFGLGIQRTEYRKDVDRPDTGNASTKTKPWLFYATAAVRISDPLVLYASYTEGLEESGEAPDFAANRGLPAPAIRTRQIDGGIRWAITPSLKLILGGFDLEKPYFNINADNRFAELGTVRNQGVELSLSGAITPRLDVVAGGVFLKPRVVGEAVDQGLVGDRPVGFSARNLTLNFDWRPTADPNFTTDIRLTHRSEVTATTDNIAEIPALTLVDIGVRIPVSIAGADASLRLSVSNLLDEQGLNLRGAGAYDIVPGRQGEARFSVDF